MNNKLQELQEQTLKKYFSIEGNVATLKLVYDTFSELVNQSFGDDKTEKLNEKLFSDIREAASLLPSKYKLDLLIHIRDFGDYTREECEDIIRHNVALFAYEFLRARNRKLISGWSLIGVGALVLIASYILHDKELWFDLINISGTLFVWEGVNMAFIEKNADSKALRTLAKKIGKITIEGGDYAQKA